VRARLASLLAAVGWLVAAPAAPADTLSMSTYFGGSHHDQIKDVAVDAAGNVYVTGWTASPDFPLRNPRFGFTGGADEFECEEFGCPDAFVAKLARDGRSLIYSTYLGGSRLDEGTGIAVDAAGAAYVVGKSNSEPGGVFVMKLAPDGSAVEWTRRIGPISELTPADVAVDGSGHVYVSGTTWSPWFETTEGAYDRDCIDFQYFRTCVDSFVARFTSGGTLLATTMFGGHDSHEETHTIAIDRAGRPVIAGAVSGPQQGFPRTPGTFGQTPEGTGNAAFVARLSADLSRLEWAAAFGGRSSDYIFDMALDAQDRPVIAGLTESYDFPTTPGAFDRICDGDDDWEACPHQSDGFAATMNADGSGLVWSTYVGGSGDDAVYALALGPQGDVALTGIASAAYGFPLVDAYQSDSHDDDPSCFNRWYCDDAFLVRLSEAGALTYGSLLGGGSQDAGEGVAVGRDGTAWLGGVAYSSDFPVTSGQRAGGDCPTWEYYDNPECSDGFLTAFASLPAAPPAGSSPGAAAPVATTSAAPRLTVRRSGRRVSGRLRGCPPRARLLVERRARGRWRIVRRVRTRADGRYSFRLPAREGRYRLRAPCADLRSRVISLR
jgi:Beta-propeller repeat